MQNLTKHTHRSLIELKQNRLAKRIFINNQIRASEVRLIDEKGEQMGVVSLEAALQLAKERNLDLIQVTEKVDPPVARLGNYGKYLYQQEKKEREMRKKGGGELKEIRLTFNISDHDMETRVTQAHKFLSKGDRIRIVLRLRGREKALKNHAREKVEKFVSQLTSHIPTKVEKPLQQEPRGLTMIITKQ
tara:strand:+ start:2270 stop:2836 length:567 start_codon:yes stop_codon:yes gene_type:complete